MAINIQYLWKDRKRYFGLPLSFTRYKLSDDRAAQFLHVFLAAEVVDEFVE